MVTIEGANIREQPSTSAAIVTTVNAGTVLTIIGPPVDAEGRTWWPVTVVDLGISGYIAAELITPQV